MDKLRFTVSVGDSDRQRLGQMVRNQFGMYYAYIHGEAEHLAGFDIADYIDGDILQLTEPIEQQDIEMLLPHGKRIRINAYYSCCDDYFLLIMPGDEASLTDYEPDMHFHSDPHTCTADYCRARYRLYEKPKRDAEHAEWLRRMQEKDYLTGWQDCKEGD